MAPNRTQAEGFILGVGAEMFMIAGPVIVYGALANIGYGLIHIILMKKGLTGMAKPFNLVFLYG